MPWLHYWLYWTTVFLLGKQFSICIWAARSNWQCSWEGVWAGTRILGPYESPSLPNFCTSGLGLAPKHNGDWWTIYHLSAPPNCSVNNFINPDDNSLSYCSIDDAYAFINELDPDTLLSKIDLKDAVRLIPINPSDWNLLGIHWRGKFYVNTCLPFGLRLVLCLFNILSQTIHWITTNNYGVQHLLHYLNDFLTAGPADWESALKTLMQC